MRGRCPSFEGRVYQLSDGHLGCFHCRAGGDGAAVTPGARACVDGRFRA